MSDNKEYRRKLERKGKIKCSRCKPHQGENEGRKPRPDKYKNKRLNKHHMDPAGEKVVVPTFPGGGGPMTGAKE